ncbi:glutaredoxin-like protein [Plasmodium knowlesi strain H]|uniref:Glutaredoxin-like protein n=3 Tax=Plasmodium knowlesi TaxID=5850 RepID=A0A5K1VE93_PLAKH|nr:glutaredoxin-like protein [Plasmodium knowlesi strain H]OTN64591.1 Glutaredoxin-like protein [Plasmodium knowlesi]CAA9989260.1 glutaredoxin-like protein [Plasmodium knowlesi strain H]SBO26168.1 glutaredoxin-like protein [Plasmodium knowlesi strain H]SBO26950.1 glutaredoxin-like protein [Plasmodium knowlesi strain H]VVS78734.1 glutaredoxin-like protein [Plasmodium knowlesi strain H]|eukprot:XP_002261606.1 glutaredoxin-like protein [Plasmodium knowlesi strain H]
MNFIKEEEKDKFVEGHGLKLLYLKSSKEKEYELHMEVCQAIVEDCPMLEVYVVSPKEENNENGVFEFYQNGQIIKKFANCNVSTVTSFIRKYIQRGGSSMEATQSGECNSTEKSDTVKKIEQLITNNKIILFMKGSKTFPQCKFSNAVVFMLNSCKIKYTTFDILQDQDVRNELKVYSNWPTYPQLYINKELIGGHDIIKSMYDSGDLREVIPEDCFEE